MLSQVQIHWESDSQTMVWEIRLLTTVQKEEPV